MSKQEINIQNNTGTINIYNSPDTEDGKEERKISMAAVDKYSSPLTASISLTPWGDKNHRVSFLLRNDLIGQVLQRNYIVFDEKKSAKEFYNKLINDIEGFKKQAELERRHNVLIVADIFNLMNKYEKSYNTIGYPESSDLKARTENLNQSDFQGAKPYGLVFHDLENHFPSHEGIVKCAKKTNQWNYDIEKIKDHKIDKISEIKNIKEIKYKIGSTMIESSMALVESPQIEDLKKVASLSISNYLDTEEEEDKKLKILSSLRPLFENKKEDISTWLNNNSDLLKKISEKLICLGSDYSSSKYKKITQDDYDIFIFDADKTLWDGASAYKMQVPFNIEKNKVTDANGEEVVLKEGVRNMLAGLINKGKRVGLVSHSEKENVDFQDQPVILLLKAFGIFKYFNEMIVIAKELPKSIFIPNENRILFIDDRMDNLIEVVENTNADGALPKNIEYSPKTVSESVLRTGIVKVAEILKYEEDFIPMYIVSGDHPTIRDEKYWEEKERSLLNDFWYVSSNENEDFESFLNDMATTGIRPNRILESVEDVSQKPLVANGLSIMIKLTPSGIIKLSPNSYVEAKRERVPSSEIPKKPNDGKEYELDHKKPLHEGGENKKNNLQWIEKNKHKKKTQNEGSYEYGGKDRHKKLKEKGKDTYKKYQSDTGKAKVEKERKEIGEKAFSEKQRQRAKKRWKNAGLDQWYKMIE